MKGIGKAFARTPYQVTSKIGVSKKSVDPEFEDYNRHFSNLETAAERMIKETKSFCEAVTLLFNHGHGFATHFSTLFQPIAGEYDLIGKNPDAERTIRNVTKHEAAMEELRQLVAPELELIESRILGPVKEVQTIMKQIRKAITKRDHKRVDYDRFNNQLTKLRDKKDKSLNDEKNLFKLEQDFEIATNEYEYINMALKQDLPRFMVLSTQFIDPLFNSFFYMQLNIYYLILEKMNSFADEGKYDVGNIPGSQIAQEYEEKRTDAWHIIENMSIIKRIVSVSRLVQASRSQNGVQRASSTAPSTSSGGSGSLRSPPPSSSLSSAAAYKKTPPPPPSFASSSINAAPPPYTPSAPTNGQSVAAAAMKRAPPPPAVASKPKPKPVVQYVVALYDFAAQADGDLSFSAGDRIEIVERTPSTEDWWTGRLNGQQGVFPGNYVQET